MSPYKNMDIDSLAAYHSAIIDSSEDAIVSKNLNSIVTSWNKAAETIFGYKAEEVIGKHISIIMPPERISEEDTIISNIRAGRPIEHFETIRRRKDGVDINISVSISPIKNKDGVIIGAAKIARDITKQKKLERQRDDFISMATHELKTPVTSIKAYAQVLKKVFAKRADPSLAQYLEKMDMQLNKLSNLISDLLDVSKLQSGQLYFNKENFNFNELVLEVVEEMQRTTEKHKLIAKIPQNAMVSADRDRLGQVITNFISNAIKYSPQADKIIIKTELKDGEVQLGVKDFGVGIPKESQPQIFEKFYRVEGRKQETFPGMGLGLYICSEIIRRQRGNIWVESELGQGSTFYFSLPLK